MLKKVSDAFLVVTCIASARAIPFASSIFHKAGTMQSIRSRAVLTPFA